MKNLEYSEEEKMKGQQEINKWFESLPAKATEALKELEEKISQMETFDLLSNISLYNHLQDPAEYKDFRGDKMFTVSELIALVALKKNYVTKSNLDIQHSGEFVRDIQRLGYEYFSFITFLQLKEENPKNDHTFEGIAFRTKRDETIIRNPALPEHHLQFSLELYSSFENDIKKKFGFSINESIIIRESVVNLINKKVNTAKDEAANESYKLANEVFNFRAKKIVPKDTILSEETLNELNKLSRKKIKEACYNYCINNLFFHLGSTFSFTVKELAIFSNLDDNVVESFLKTFSCTFPSLSENEDLVGPNHILKFKPIVEFDNNFLVPSLPLLTWCVEPLVENYFKSIQKLQGRFINEKHNFLLKKGADFFSLIFQDKVEILKNLYYNDANNRYETDGLFKYERTLFIIEAKAHRISQAAKEGKIIRTEKHLEEIVKDSYDQGLRTLNYIKSSSVAVFLTERNKKIEIKSGDFDEFILISLVLEPIGNVTPLIRATNELGYFKHNVFPWIISLYDLIIFADHLEFPVLLPHYIKRRKEFLERKMMHVFEEIDLLSYYLFNRLHIENIIKDAEENNANFIYMDNETDAINNYYMQKYRYKNPNPPKLNLKLPDVFMSILQALQQTNFSHRQEIMMHILDISPSSIDKFKIYIEKIKGMFAKDGKKHDCSIMTEIWGKKIGFTFITGQNKLDVDKSLYFYCQYKLDEMKADEWIGFGDIEQSKNKFNIQSAFLART